MLPTDILNIITEYLIPSEIISDGVKCDEEVEIYRFEENIETIRYINNLIHIGYQFFYSNKWWTISHSSRHKKNCDYYFVDEVE